MSDLIDRQPAIETVGKQPESTRTFVELVVEYPDQELCTYKEYKGKPYYSIKYIENGEKYVGYGTYKPEVLSQYLKEYFMPSAERKGRWFDYVDWCKCSVCKTTQSAKTKYCPHCGALMEVDT